MDKLALLEAQYGELLDIELEIMKFNFELYEKIQHFFDKRKEEYKKMIYELL